MPETGRPVFEQRLQRPREREVPVAERAVCLDVGLGQSVSGDAAILDRPVRPRLVQRDRPDGLARRVTVFCELEVFNDRGGRRVREVREAGAMPPIASDASSISTSRPARAR